MLNGRILGRGIDLPLTVNGHAAGCSQTLAYAGHSAASAR